MSISIPVSNSSVAELLRRYAAVLALDAGNRFKVKAYRRAAETIEQLEDSVSDRVAQRRDLTELPAIGAAISHVIEEIVQTGHFHKLDEVTSQLPPEQAELTSRPLLDPKVVARTYKKLGIKSLEELRDNLETGAVRERLGTRVEFQLRRGLDDRPRHLRWSILKIAPSIERRLRSLTGLAEVSQAGSLRRRQDTVGDLNYLVTSRSAASLFKAFQKFGAVQTAAQLGPHEWSYQLSSGVTVRLQWTRPDQWGLVLILATGSRGHLRELEEQAQRKGLTLEADSLTAAGIDVSEERAIYRGLGLAWIEPELREGRGEIAAARTKVLPRLLKQSDLRGDLHCHTTESDGSHTLEQMVAAARQRDYEYLAITDHSQSLKITNGLTEARLRDHIRHIDRLNETLDGFRILKSAEVDILADGRLDYSNAMLRELDLTICSIHSRFSLNRQQQTERILRAMDNPYFNILGHATGRLLLKREGYDLDVERIIEHAKARGCLFEINSSPDRLDLSDEHARMVKEAGILIAVNTDAHAIRELDFISAGVDQARRAWLEAGDVLNTRPVDEVLNALRRDRPRRSG